MPQDWRWLTDVLSLPGTKPEDATIVRIRDTLHLGEIAVSENLLPLVRRTAGMELIGPATPLA